MKILRRIQAPLARLCLSLALALAVLAPQAAEPRPAQAAGAYVVDVTADGADLDINNGVCDAGAGACTLRAAIQEARNDGGSTLITFHQDLMGATLVLSDSLNSIQWVGSQITVTGEAKNITISGDNFTGVENLFDISGNGNTLAHLTLQGARAAGVKVGDIAQLGTGNDNRLDSLIIIGNGNQGIHVYGGITNGGRRNHITHNWIGMSDSSALACVGGELNGTGVLISDGAIGTDVTGNVIGCSGIHGVVIDGSNGSPLATNVTNNRIGIGETDGDLGNFANGVTVLAGAGGVTLNLNTISGNAARGISISPLAAQGFTITQNLIGTNSTGALAVPNGLQGIVFDGVTAANARIADNTISGNLGAGLQIINSAGVTLARNIIGLNQAGTGALPNGGGGVALTAGAHDNLIGGDQAARNVISGNTTNGVLLDGADTTTNTVSGNYIGVNLDGDAALPNTYNGVRLDNGAHDNIIGGPANVEFRNIISGNNVNGVLFIAGAHNNQLDGNYIGLSADGAAALPNGASGVALITADDNLLGSVGAIIPQLISGNGREGIYIVDSYNTTIGESNGIGIALVPSLKPMGNGWEGIAIYDAGGTLIEASYVAYNGLAGVAVVDASPSNKVIPVFNGLNGGLPIDLGKDGPTPNDPGDVDSGPNGSLNYPVVTALAGAVVTGTACANCQVFVYKAIGNPGAPGGGGLKLGQTTANGSGGWSLSGLPAGLTKLDISAVACQGSCAPAGPTSEMSPRPVLYLPVLFRP